VICPVVEEGVVCPEEIWGSRSLARAKRRKCLGDAHGGEAEGRGRGRDAKRLEREDCECRG
jgi:hypothetical protein